MRIIPFITALLLLMPVASAGGAPVINVEVRGVSGPMLDNVNAYLSLRRFARAEDLDQDQVDRLALRARREALEALKPFGHYRASAEVVVENTTEGWLATVTVEPGEPVMLRRVEVFIEGAGSTDPSLWLVAEDKAPQVDKALSHPAYAELKGALQRAAAVRGYADASFSTAEILVDVEAGEAEVKLVLDTGPRYRFGETRFAQDSLDPKLIARYLRYREGDWYDTSLLLQTQFALDDSDYFRIVEVLPQERDRDTLTVPIRIDAEDNLLQRYRVGLGYATDTEARALLGWNHRRLNRRGHRLSLEARVSSPEQALDASYVVPWRDPAMEKLALKLSLGKAQRGDVETDGLTLAPSLTQTSGRWQRVLFMNFDYTRDSLVGAAGADAEVSTDRSHLLVPGISLSTIPPGFIGSEPQGRGLYAELIGSAGALGSDADFLRLLVRDERRLDLGGPWHLVLRGELGLSLVEDFGQLPSQYRFFAGGDRSVRGYGYQELSPRDVDGNRVGGRHLLIASMEVERDLPRNLGLAVFVDGGNAFDNFGDRLQYSAGIGLRYRLPFLVVGVDVAQSLSEPGRAPRFHLNFSPIL
ncbi:MAG: autotransporter assembly complex protein TamA [Steroidobacteraceae bacterium]